MLVMILMFIFTKLLSIIILKGNLVPKSEVLQIGRNLVQGTLLYFNAYFFKDFFIHIFLGKFV